MISFPIEFTEIFPGFVRVIVADSVLSGLKYYAKQVDDLLTDWIQEEEVCTSNGKAVRIPLGGQIYLAIIIKRDSGLSVLIHESLHMAFYFLSHYDVPITMSDHEILCRTQQALLNKTLPELKKRKIELK
jgi:hypothetical protein